MVIPDINSNMETPTKTTLQVIQELISLQSSKLEKQAARNGPAEERAKQDDPVIKKLMSELSQHGDAVSSDVEKTDPYLDIEDHDERSFQEAVDRLLTQAGELPESLQIIIQSMRIFSK